MKPRARSLVGARLPRAVHSLLSGFVVIASANCSSGGKGGQHNTVADCQPRNGPNSYWGYVHAAITLVNPPCPYSVVLDSNNVFISFAIQAFNHPTVSGQWYVSAGPNAHFILYDYRETISHAWSDQFWPFYISGQIPGVYFSADSVQAYPHWVIKGNTGDHEYGTVAIDVSQYPITPIPQPKATNDYVLWSALAAAGSSQALGPSSVAAVSSNSWRAYPYWDTTSFSYQWIEDGTKVVGATHATYLKTWNNSGSHTLKVVVTRADAMSDTVAVPVSVTYTASIAGPSPVRNGNGCTWSAIVNGGGGTTTYAWKKNGSVVGGNNVDLTTSFSANGTLSITVTDGYGNVATASKTITVSAGAPICGV